MAKLSKKQRETATLILTLAVLVFVALNSNLFFLRLDLTENKTYSLSRVSRNLFREIEEEVTITYYLSDRLRTRAPETQQIVDLLTEYEAFSRGAIDVRIVDPTAAGVTAEAENFGVVPQQIQVVEQDQQSFAVVYTGIVISYLEDSTALPVVFEPEAIEYEVTSAIRNLVEDRTNVIGILLDQPGASLQQNYQLLTSRLTRNYEIRPIEPGEEIPPDVRTLIVIGGSGLDEYALFEIDQYIMSGGTVLFAYDPIQVNVQQGLSAFSPEEQPIIDFLAHYGVRPRRELVLDTYNRRIPIQVPQGPMLVQRLEPYPPWVSVLGSSANSEHPITARFSGLDLYWASSLDLVGEEDQVTVLLESSQESWTMEAPYMIDPIEPFGMMEGRAEGSGNYVLAAALSGSFDSYFDTMALPPRPGDEEPVIPDATSVDSARLVVVGDSEFAGNYTQFTESQYNIVFLENALGWLANDEDLLSIRTRAVRDVRLNAIQDPEVRDGVATFAELFNVFVMPLLVVVAGIGRFFFRRRRAQLGVAPAEPKEVQE
jgi:gliding-associated putative ABC transporter substrate-binding component GldG